MLPVVSKELGKALFNAIMSKTWPVMKVEVTLGDCALKVDVRGFGAF